MGEHETQETVLTKKKKRPPKIPNPLSRVREAVRSGNYKVSEHGVFRQATRQLTRFDCEQVLTTGYREPSKDDYKEEYKRWVYAFRGKTEDGTDVRICVAFYSAMLIVTVINLDLKEG